MMPGHVNALSRAAKARCVMVLGTTSGAGKSWLATALCRWYARQGLRVAPFKAQNMSNNARVVAGGEIGSAQYFQALAARREPDARMNPLLLKPEADNHSQVVLLGQVDEDLSRASWRGRSRSVWPRLVSALDALRAENDVLVIEGAGSPAEINLRDCDVVNMSIALHADAECLLVTDIDRGGAFAHLYGTWALLTRTEQERVRGFVLNKFRGDPELLAPGPEQLERLTGVPTVATLPMWRHHGLPEEDGVFDARAHSCSPVEKTIAVIAYPRISNLDEFQPLRNVPGVRLVWARTPGECDGADWLILPGSKHTSSDLAWLRAQGLDSVVVAHAMRGGAVLGICGGLQMLGDGLVDSEGVDGNARGLGLLPLVTVFAREKTVRKTTARFTTLNGLWACLSGLEVTGYEIHHGLTQTDGAAPQCRPAMDGDLAWQNAAGNILGTYVHGLFESTVVMRALFDSQAPDMDSIFDGLADFADRHFAPGFLQSLLN
jgi:adenosylcobyric acid synthase